MARLKSTRYVGRGIVSGEYTIYFDEKGVSDELPDDVASAVAKRLRDTRLTKEKTKTGVKSKTKATEKKRGNE